MPTHFMVSQEVTASAAARVHVCMSAVGGTWKLLAAATCLYEPPIYTHKRHIHMLITGWAKVPGSRLNDVGFLLHASIAHYI